MALRQPKGFDTLIGIFAGMSTGFGIMETFTNAASTVSGGNVIVTGISALFGLAAGAFIGLYTGHAAMIGSAQIGADPTEQTITPPSPDA